MLIKYLHYFVIFLVLTTITLKSHAETTVIDLNINKSNVQRPSQHNNVCGSDKLCISYRSKKSTPSCCNKSSLLDGNETLLGLLTNKCGKSSSCDMQSEYLGDLYYFEAGLGRTINYADGEQEIKRNPTIPFADTFKVESIGKGALLSVAGGYVWKFDSSFVPYASLGAEYSYMPSVKMNGSIFAKAETPAYRYDYSVSHSNLRLVGKVNLYKWKSFMPYASLGLGGSCNLLKNYKEFNFTLARTTPVRFKDQKSFEFSYSAGLGLDYLYRKDFLLSLGYRYDNFGSNSTGDAVGLYKGQHLSNAFSSNSVVLTGRYFFE